MIFDDAFAEALKITPKECTPGGENVPKILAFLWTMIAVSKNKLDDLAYISENKQIISIPLQKSDTKTAKEKTKAVKVKKTNGKEKKEKSEEPITTESTS